MQIIDKVADVFNILHDGSIKEWWDNEHVLTLKISCQYLAELIHPDFNFFFIDLVGAKIVELQPWWDNIIESDVLIKLEEIFAGELEILSAKVTEGKVQIACNQRSKSLSYIGGNLMVSCENVVVYDEAKTELSLNEFDKICNAYWASIGKS
jgi:hypothetical protein